MCSCSLVVLQKTYRRYDSECEACTRTAVTISVIDMCQQYTVTSYNEFLASPKVTIKSVAILCLSWHGLINKVRSPGRVLIEVKHRFDPGEHAQHHHSHTQNIYSKSSFNLEQEKCTHVSLPAKKNPQRFQHCITQS